MKEKLDTENYGHNTWGGFVLESDFCTDNPRPNEILSWADRIASDLKFDKWCKNMQRKRKEKQNNV